MGDRFSTEGHSGNCSLDICWEDRNEQKDQSPCGSNSERRVENTQSPGYFRHTADGNKSPGPWEIRRDHLQIDRRREEVIEPCEDEENCQYLP